MHVQIFGDVHAANGIGNDTQRTSRNHHRHDRQTVQTIRQVHRVGRAHNDDHREGHKEVPEVQQSVLEDREGQLVGQRIGVILRRPKASHSRDQEAQKQPNLTGNARCVLLFDLGVIIGKTDGCIAQRDEKNQPDKGVIQSRPQQGRGDNRADDQQTTHGGRACFDKMAFRAVAPDRLAFALLAAQHVDQRRAKEETEQQGRQKRATSTERDIAEQVEHPSPVRKLGQPVQHWCFPLSLLGLLGPKGTGNRLITQIARGLDAFFVSRQPNAPTAWTAML